MIFVGLSALPRRFMAQAISLFLSDIRLPFSPRQKAIGAHFMVALHYNRVFPICKLFYRPLPRSSTI